MKQLQIDLSNWEFRACGDDEWLTAVVPGTVHTDLLRNGVIDQPFYGTNEHELQWIDKKDWEYRTGFVLEEAWQTLAVTELVFAGLDTYADVYVNGVHALSADNMFLSWTVNVKGLLRTGKNELHIVFRSVVTEDLPKLAALGYALPAPNDQSELGGLQEQRISVFARKAPYHYGWDWGPRFLTSGIWREAMLTGRNVAAIEDLYIRQHAVNEQEARLTAVIEADAPEAWNGMLRVSTEGQEWMKAVTLVPGKQSIELELVIDRPRLWWCNGLGTPELYHFRAELLQEAQVVAVSEATTGLREMKLVRKPDAQGASFHFELNGVPVFAKGANHIPNDSFITEVTEERYRHEIATAVESNMNMLRVWGGGFYEEEVFYRLCDEYGLLVWQDFMFACSMYPGDEAFLNNVRAEAVYNVRRLRNHPCIALWCGNNEIDSAWSQYEEYMGWGWKEKLNAEIRQILWAAYEEIFHRILPEAVAANHPGMDYWPSSPLRELTGAQDQHATRIKGDGDVHYWGVWHAKEPFENYNLKVGRFMSEYGFQSFPELKSVLSYAEEAELALESKVMLAHQKNGAGNQLIKEYMDMYLPQPKDFRGFLYMSQVLQAEAIRMAMESHRRNKPYCMGTLYWQMNDCWPVASWAGMDYYGRWKALQYTVRRSFQEVLLSVDSTDGESVKVYGVSDRREALDAELVLRLHDISGVLLREWSQPVTLAEDSSAVIFTLPLAEVLEGREPASVLLVASLLESGQIVEQGTEARQVQEQGPETRQVLERKEHYFAAAKDIPLSQPVITVTEVPGSGGQSFTLSSDVLARGVHLTVEEEGIFSDNYFDLLPGEPKTVEFSLRSSGNGGGDFIPAAPTGLVIRSMADYI
ncbi:glycoside hydrolase family 2 protein [Paenibacillus sp. FSL P4-0338]|uniref:beta-mannosidase n=1 Tax=unclassified Paenibacillus TaxID=185978 RepID=UPI0003E28D9D|nr:glycoside hydrolase family 2 protein [Paenibacillus sp. FSL R7-269]ETT30739.1 glycoside hydrolase family protein [Paenibacillus sp. FSL R7-269]